MRRARRVLAVVATLRGGGAERVLAGIASAAAAAGREVTVVTIFPPAADDYPLHPRCKRLSLDGGRTSRNLVRAALSNLTRVRKLRGVLRAERPDVVLSFMDTTNVLAILAAIATGVRVVVSERVDPRMYQPGFPWPLLRDVTYPRADAIVVQTEAVAAGWARPRYGTERVHVIPNPVTLPAASTAHAVGRADAAASGVLLAVGRLDRQKGFDHLLRAYAAAVDEGLTVPLAIVGEGDARPALEALVAELGLAGRVSLPGRITTIEDWYSRAHAFVLSSRYEGFPNVLLEALAHGIPSVATDCQSGPADILAGGAGLLVPVDDLGAMTRALVAVCTDQTLRGELRAKARAAAARYEAPVVLKQWDRVLGLA